MNKAGWRVGPHSSENRWLSALPAKCTSSFLSEKNGWWRYCSWTSPGQVNITFFLFTFLFIAHDQWHWWFIVKYNNQMTRPGLVTERFDTSSSWDLVVPGFFCVKWTELNAWVVCKWLVVDGVLLLDWRKVFQKDKGHKTSQNHPTKKVEVSVNRKPRLGYNCMNASKNDDHWYRTSFQISVFWFCTSCSSDN